MAKSIDLNALAEKLTDDTEFELGGEKFTGADLKTYIGNQKAEFKKRDDELAATRGEHDSLRKRFEQFEGSTSALLRAAAAEAARNPTDNGASAAPQQDPDWATYEKDPLFSPFANVFERRLMQNLDSSYFKPWVEKSLNPVLEAFRRENGALTTMLLDERNRREYRELGEWPENYNLDEARKFGAERGYFLPNTDRIDPQTGRRVGVVDLGRVHQDVMGPVLRDRRDAEKEKEITERVTRELRANATIISPPNRTLNGQPLPKAKGKTPEEIFGNVMNEAAADLETQRVLTGMTGR